MKLFMKFVAPLATLLLVAPIAQSHETTADIIARAESAAPLSCQQKRHYL